MTKEEVMEKYGNTPLMFSSYYKYTFSFKATVDGLDIVACVGGFSDDIYRMSVRAGECITLNDEYHYRAAVYQGKETLWSEGGI